MATPTRPPTTTATRDLSAALRSDYRDALGPAIEEMLASIEAYAALREEEMRRPVPVPASESRSYEAAIALLLLWLRRTKSTIFNRNLTQRVRRALESAARVGANSARRNLSAIGIQAPTPPIDGAVRVQSQTLDQGVKGRQDAYAGQVYEIAAAALLAGRSVASIRAQSRKLLKIAEKRTRLLARETVGDVVSEIEVSAYTTAGVKDFIWRSQGDSRVRPLHRKLNGQRFSFARGAPGEGLPGQPPNCRCWAEPVRE